MNDIELKPIETEYNGYKFRSRLEARWAVFFDTAGVEYEYEPEGFELSSGYRYLPDFLVHNCTERAEGDLWVEVKGKATKYDADRIWEFAENNPILVVDCIPKGNTASDLWSEMIWRSGNCMGDDFRLYPFNFDTIDGDAFGLGVMANGKGGLALCGADSSYYHGFDEELTVRAYQAARQARFEYGCRG